MGRRKIVLGVAILALVGVGCSTGAKKRLSRSHQHGISKSARLFLEKENAGEIPKYDIPIQVNEKVLSQIDYLLRNRARFSRYLSRSGRYESWMKGILKEEGLPEDIFYLALVESGFSNHALSRAKALGPWQFIPSTGRIYGLKGNWWLDERKDPEKATRAASRYLRKLYNDFGDWYLAFAAYNAGEGRVAKAIREGRSQNFWALSAPGSNYLKQETKDYVPRIIAAALIAKMPEQFGLGKIPYEELIAYDEFKVKGPLDLQVAAGLIGMNPEDLAFLNPELNQPMTPPGFYSMKIPSGKTEQFKLAYAKLPPSKRRVEVATHRVKRGDTLWTIAKQYRVSTKSIVSANHLRGKRAYRLRVGTRLVIPRQYGVGEGGLATYATAEKTAIVSPPAKVWKTNFYKVRKGDTLAEIARRYGVSVPSLKASNGIKGEWVKEGQRLKIRRLIAVNESGGILEVAYNDAPKKVKLDGVEWLIRKEKQEDPQPLLLARKEYSPPFEEESGVPQSVVIEPEDYRKETNYVVRRGDNLWKIAQKHGVSISDLKEWNNLDGKAIRPGRKLVVDAVQNADGIADSNPSAIILPLQNEGGQAPKSQRIWQDEARTQSASGRHVVKRGDSLWEISRRYGVTVAKLKEWNHLTSNDLRPGETLKLFPAGVAKAPEKPSSPSEETASDIDSPEAERATATPPSPSEEGY